MTDSNDASPGLRRNERGAARERARDDERTLGSLLGLKWLPGTEAALFLCGLAPSGWADPSAVEVFGFDFLPNGRRPEWDEMNSNELRQNVELQLDFVKRFIAADGLPRTRSPRDWLKLADENGYVVPFRKFARSRPALRKYLPEMEAEQENRERGLQQQIDALEAEIRDLREQLGRRGEPGVKERSSMLRIIAAMAADGYKWDIRVWKADVFKRIAGAAEGLEEPVSSGTVRKYLYEAGGEIGGPP